MLRCLVCRKQCSSSVLLKEHVSKHIFNVPMYECRNCKKHFKDKASYVAHFKQAQFLKLCRHGYLYKNSFVCPLCGRRFIKKSTCVEHIQLHDEMVFDCTKCGWTFDTLYRVQVHKALRHGSPHVSLPTTMKKSSREDSNTTRLNNVHSLPQEDSGNQSANANFDVQAATNENGNRRKSTRKIFKKVFAEWKPYARMKYQCPELNCKMQYAEYRDFQSHCKKKHGISITKQNEELYLLRQNETINRNIEWQTIPNDTHTWEDTKYGLSNTIRFPMKNMSPDICQTQHKSECGISENVIDDTSLKGGESNNRYQCPEQSCRKLYAKYLRFRSHCLHKHGRHLNKRSVQKYLTRNADKVTGIKGDKVGVKRLTAVQGTMKKKYLVIDTINDMSKGSYFCDKASCGKVFNSFGGLYCHMRRTHGKRLKKETYLGQDTCSNKSSLKIRKCPICGRNKVDEYHVQNHEKMIYTCPKANCGWRYEDINTYRCHCLRKHGISIRVRDKETSFRTCSVCGRINIDENHMKNHEKMVHKCPMQDCGWMYENLSTLRTHVYRKHGKGFCRYISNAQKCPISKCPICGRYKGDEYHIKNHDKMIYTCPEPRCGWMYENLNTYRCHCLRKHGISIGGSRGGA